MKHGFSKQLYADTGNDLGEMPLVLLVDELISMDNGGMGFYIKVRLLGIRQWSRYC